MVPTPGPVQDRLGRPLRDLRISVTDRCNFRCAYCMPRAAFGPDHRFLPRAEILSFEEITRVARAARGLGVRKLRLTGGEPLLRRDLPVLVRALAGIGGLDLALTTNGVLLAQHAGALAGAGLGRVTVSVDSLDPDTFRRLADADVALADVLAGIDAAERAGLTPLKINCVVRRGENEAGIVELARFFQGRATVRFIELMDVGTRNGWRPDQVVPAREIVERIDRELPLEELPRDPGGEVARRLRYRDGSGEIGVIASVTEPFCGTCTRARLSADGHLYTCLFATRGTDLRPVLRGPEGAGDAALEAALGRVWATREDRYSELRGSIPAGRRIEMSYIGG
ncbi:MAG: GTP 3',8-cyclase MoaA [Deltaproteobacteria bacterium]|nr:GTP 3',8-cyclase MoaA [Deltaproteobacteria bacterium]